MTDVKVDWWNLTGERENPHIAKDISSIARSLERIAAAQNPTVTPVAEKTKNDGKDPDHLTFINVIRILDFLSVRMDEEGHRCANMLGDTYVFSRRSWEKGRWIHLPAVHGPGPREPELLDRIELHLSDRTNRTWVPTLSDMLADDWYFTRGIDYWYNGPVRPIIPPMTFMAEGKEGLR